MIHMFWIDFKKCTHVNFEFDSSKQDTSVGCNTKLAKKVSKKKDKTVRLLRHLYWYVR